MGAIVINDLTKRLGKDRVLSELNLEVLEGEFFALLGLSGSGKTTLCKILFNFLKPTKGKAYIYDMDCQGSSKAIKESVSFVPQEVSSSENPKAISIFKKTLSYHNLKNDEEIGVLCDYFNFDSKLRLQDMDAKEKRIFSIINALIVRPRLLIIDEPTYNMDDSTLDKLFRHLNTLKTDENLTVFMLSDSLSFAQKYCDRVAYISGGSIRDIEYVKDKNVGDKLITIYNSVHDPIIFTNIGAKIVSRDDNKIVYYYDKDMKIFTNMLAGLSINNYTVEHSSLSNKIEAYYENKEEVVE